MSLKIDFYVDYIFLSKSVDQVAKELVDLFNEKKTDQEKGKQDNKKLLIWYFIKSNKFHGQCRIDWMHFVLRTGPDPLFGTVQPSAHLPHLFLQNAHHQQGGQMSCLQVRQLESHHAKVNLLKLRPMQTQQGKLMAKGHTLWNRTSPVRTRQTQHL